MVLTLVFSLNDFIFSFFLTIITGKVDQLGNKNTSSDLLV